MEVKDTEAALEPHRVHAALGCERASEPERVTGGWDTLLWPFSTPDAREHSLRVYLLPRVRSLTSPYGI